ncbi:hypothetical protein ABZ942_00365 [Nocardia sp. NPDC046473]|uniref:hypothetical protein n=1 Tax=Nocardia sp. NPDC046473 TaxID=3155733 RepID=UPI0033EDB3E2
MRRPITVFLFPALVAALLAGCSSQHDDHQSAAETTAAAPADCTQQGKYPPTPTVDLLNTLLQRGLDPNIPATDKFDLMQGAAGDPDLFNRMIPALNKANFAVAIKGVTDYCNGTANADATLNFYGQPNDSQVPLVAEDGKWKLERVWACGLAASLQQTSPIC